VPVRESTTNKEVAKMVASKLGIANPGDYILVTIKNGEGNVKYCKIVGIEVSSLLETIHFPSNKIVC
jgi:hypothetical protein